MVEDDLREALIGPEPDLVPSRLWRIAIHEAGHAILYMALDTATPIDLSIDGVADLVDSAFGDRVEADMVVIGQRVELGSALHRAAQPVEALGDDKFEYPGFELFAQSLKARPM